MERNEETTEDPGAAGAAKDPQDPTDTTPRGNPPVDEEALERGEETLARVKPY